VELLAAMPHELYLVRWIHQQTRKAFPGERLGTAEPLASAATVRFGNPDDYLRRTLARAAFPTLTPLCVPIKRGPPTGWPL
jgi:hypothetical protein